MPRAWLACLAAGARLGESKRATLRAQAWVWPDMSEPVTQYLRAQWTAPTGIVALSTLRTGHGGDDFRAESARDGLTSGLGIERLLALKQVHGCHVVKLDGVGDLAADACWTERARVACMVLSADCLPALFASEDGRVIAAAHAGWRGLLAGVLEQTLRALPQPAERLHVWLGPAIAQAAFEVGPEIRTAFIAAAPGAQNAFRAGQGDRWHADLYVLARQRLVRAGVDALRISGGGYCTHSEQRFHSHRRDGALAGRMANLVFRREG